VDPFPQALPAHEELVVDPPQPEAVVRALESLLGAAPPATDPWWRAGNDEARGA
jgi:hypothetical protein